MLIGRSTVGGSDLVRFLVGIVGLVGGHCQCSIDVAVVVVVVAAVVVVAGSFGGKA